MQRATQPPAGPPDSATAPGGFPEPESCFKDGDANKAAAISTCPSPDATSAALLPSLDSICGSAAREIISFTTPKLPAYAAWCSAVKFLSGGRPLIAAG